MRQRGVEVAGISPDPGPSADLRREHREGPAQQLGGRWPDVVVAGHQVHRQRQFGLCPARQVHPAGPDAGVVPADTFLGPAVDLDVGGVQIDGRVPGHQRRPDRRGNPRQPAGVDLRQSHFDTEQPLAAEAASEPARRGTRRDRRLTQQRTARIGPDPVHPRQAVLPD